MQLKKKPIGASLAAATCGLLGALPSAPVAAQEVKDWDVDSLRFSFTARTTIA